MIHTKVENIYREISQLSILEKKTVLSKLMSEMIIEVNHIKKQSIADIKGLGKELWNQTDAQKYVNNERSLW